MTGIQTLAARSALGALCAIAGYILSSSSWIHRTPQRIFNRAVYVAVPFTRLGLFLLVFVVLHVAPRGDIPAFYVPEGHSAILWHVPYRDFPSSYAPLHPFVDAAVLRVWDSPLAIILFAILVECFLLPVWMRAGRLFASEAAVRTAAVLYLTSAVSLQFVAVDGQDNILIALLLGLAVLALSRNRVLLSGALTACGIGLVKFLPLLFVPAFFFITRRRFLWLIGLVAVLVLGYLPFALLHAPLFLPLLIEHALRTASDLPYILESLFAVYPPDFAEDSLLALALLAILALLARVGLRRPDSPTALRSISTGCIALALALLIFSKKSWPPYLVLVLFPLCLLVSAGSHPRTRLASFNLFSALAIITHSFWATVFLQFTAPVFHEALVHRLPEAFLFLLLQVALVAGYIWLLVQSVAELLRAGSPSLFPAGASGPHPPRE
jgi:hypothetical protein